LPTTEPEQFATLEAAGRRHAFRGRWVVGTPWQRFGLYNSYVVVRPDGRVLKMPAHAGELVPGSTEDLVAAVRAFDPDSGHPPAPMTAEIDPTYRCASRDCGGSCFSASYRSLAPTASIPTALLEEVIREFRSHGGRVVRFDGGGDPLLHRDVRSGQLVEFASRYGLKTTILTSGDLLDRADVKRIAGSGCYVRLSLNAATDATRRRFHGNRIPLGRVLAGAERLAGHLTALGTDVPVGATFLLSTINYHEVLACARLARDAGVRHFSVRRILGPPALRPQFSKAELDRLAQLLAQVERLHSQDFRVAVPWRPADEPDLNPAKGDFSASRCWQSTFKTVVEPVPETGGARVQLCGRYRGGGVGQRLSMPPLFSVDSGRDWVGRWRSSFSGYPVPRTELPRTCVSCIDRGFILMVERLLDFVGDARGDFRILHLDSPDARESKECQAAAQS
jgi:Radical SAM superfamily